MIRGDAASLPRRGGASRPWQRNPTGRKPLQSCKLPGTPRSLGIQSCWPSARRQYCWTAGKAMNNIIYIVGLVVVVVAVLSFFGLR
jgi:hypothetical protein